MNQDRTNRKLVAIFSTDVVGYSRMMEADEAWTIKSLEENKNLISSLIEEHNGRIVDAPGDNILAEFNSVINAVECAVKVEEQLNNKNSKLMVDNRMHFRIGVNLGDVVEEEDRIYGNGVNIAARIEGLAEPGGICISGTAYDQVRSKLNLEYKYLGEHSVKNIAIPIRVYRVLIDNEAARKEKKDNRSRKILNTSNIAIAIIVLFLVALGTTVTILYQKPTEPRQVTRFYCDLPEDQLFSSVLYPVISVSPDGKQFAFSTNKGIYLRYIGEMDAELIAGTSNQGAVNPFFSPDGKWIGFYSEKDKQIKKISTGGGASQVLCDCQGFSTASWDEINNIIFCTYNAENGVIGGEIMRISTSGGTPESLFKENGIMVYCPQMLPDGKFVLFTKVDTTKNTPIPQIMACSLDTKESKELLAGTAARYLSTGHLVYSVGSNLFDTGGFNLFAVPFDPERLKITGDTIPVVENIRSGGQYAISGSGTLVYLPGTSGHITSGHTLVWVSMEGKEEPVNTPPNNYLYPSISPDGTRVAFIISLDTLLGDVWIWDFLRETSTRLTNEVIPSPPTWTPDSRKIIYSAMRDSQQGIYWMNTDGTGKEEKIYSEPNRALLPQSITSDGENLVVNIVEDLASTTSNKYDIGILSMEGDHILKSLIHSDYLEAEGEISPDNRWIAYDSNELSNAPLKTDIFIRPFPEVDQGKWQVSTNGGHNPRWSPDGRNLFYLGIDNAMMAVTVEADPDLSLGTPQKLFQSSYIGISANHTIPWDINPKNGRFLMIKDLTVANQEGDNTLPRRINVVLNWFEELKQRVPVE